MVNHKKIAQRKLNDKQLRENLHSAMHTLPKIRKIL